MLYTALQQIQKRPNMYFSRPSVAQINSFISGFTFAQMLHNLPEDDDLKHFEGFREWVATRYGINTTHSWFQIIDFFASSESDSIQLFFDLLAEYQEAM